MVILAEVQVCAFGTLKCPFEHLIDCSNVIVGDYTPSAHEPVGAMKLEDHDVADSKI